MPGRVQLNRIAMVEEDSNSIESRQQQKQQEQEIQCNSLEDYLLKCLEQLDELPPSRMTVTEQHRKVVIRTLLGNGTWTKPEWTRRIKEYQIQKQWEQTQIFISQNWDALQDAARRLQERDNVASPTSFQEGLNNHQSFEYRPEKLFTFMSRGPKYQGRFERLIDDLNMPEWLCVYRSIFQEQEERVLLKAFVERQLEDEKVDHIDETLESTSRNNLLMIALEEDFPKAVPQPVDGGKSSGIQGEMDLLTFLQQRVVSANLQLLAPVFIQNQRKGRNQNKKCRYTIDLPPSCDLAGRTSELDAIVVELLPTNQVRIHEVWEAKATLHPITIRDAVCKKGQVLDYFVTENEMAHENSSTECMFLNIDGKAYSILTDETRPLLGIFGKTLLSPLSGVRRMESALGDAMLEENVTAVEEALMTGCVTISQHRLRTDLERLLNLVRKLQVSMILQSELTF